MSDPHEPLEPRTYFIHLDGEERVDLSTKFEVGLNSLPEAVKWAEDMAAKLGGLSIFKIELER